MPQLNSRQIKELGDGFLAFAQAVGNYRMENAGSLTPSQHQQIRDFHWTLLNYADDLYTTSAILVMNEVKASLDSIRQVTAEINKTYQKLKAVQKAIDVATAGVTLGAAIFSKNPQAIADAIQELAEAWKKTKK